MKIVFIIRSLARGGAERQLSYLASGLCKLGLNVSVITFYSAANNYDNLNYKRLVDSGVSVCSIEKTSRYDFFGFLLRLNKKLNEIQPQIIYSFLEMTNIISAIYKMFNPEVKLVWGKRSSDLELSKYSLILRLEHKIEKILSSMPNLIISNSNAGRKNMEIKGYKSVIEVVHNGIPNEISASSLQSYPLKNFNKIPSGYVVIGAVGRIDYAKDYLCLVDSFAIVNKVVSNIVLFIVGSVVNQDYFREIQDRISKLNLQDRIYFLPEMDNITCFYHSIDIFVSSSYTEGFSNVITEAMLHKLPCVVTNAGDSAYLIGDAGIVVERRNHIQLAEALQILVEDAWLRESLSGKACKRIVEEFGINKMISKTLILLEKL